MNIEEAKKRFIEFDNEVKLLPIINCIKRNKKSVFAFGALGFFVFLSVIQFKKNVYQGGFKIVVNDNTKYGSRKNIQPNISAITEAGGADQQLKTQIEILNSPVVLLPVLDFLNQKRVENNQKKVGFGLWKKSLSVKLVKGTTVLKIDYKDKNREYIIPILKKVSKTYQDYSGKKRKRESFLGIEYLKEQVKLYETKSKESLTAAQNYATENNLYFIRSAKKLSEDLAAPIGMENARITAEASADEIDEKINEVNNLSNQELSQNIYYYSSLVEGLGENSAVMQLKKINLMIDEKKIKYTNKDPILVQLYNERNLLSDSVRQSIISNLKAQKMTFLGTAKTLKRPKEVLSKYKILISESNRDVTLLKNLQDQLSTAKLAEAVYVDPWELITNPTLKKKHVEPDRFRISLLGAVVGLFYGFLNAFVKEKRSNKIFYIDDLNESLNLNLLVSLEYINNTFWKKDIEVVALQLSKKKLKSISLVSVGDVKQEYLIFLKNQLRESLNEFDKDFNDENIFIEDNIRKAMSSDSQLFVTSSGKITRDDAARLNKIIDLFNTNLLGFINIS